MRREMFALRHTLSLHERCGCSGVHERPAREEKGISCGPGPGSAGGHSSQISKNGSVVQQQQQQQQQHQQPSSYSLFQNDHHHHQYPHQHLQVNETIAPVGLTDSGSMPTSSLGSPPPPPVISSSLPQLPEVSVPPTSASQSYSIGGQSLPPSLSLATSHLNPAHARHLDHHHRATLSASDIITRPGSAGATFGGLSNPSTSITNFVELLQGVSSTDTTTRNGLSHHPHQQPLLKTFGLCMQDIPVRPASAPPTPSPALEPRYSTPAVDYFSATINHGNSNNANANNSGLSLSQHDSYSDLFLASLEGSLLPDNPPLIA